MRYSVYLGNCTRSSRSPPTLVIPILVYHGPPAWSDQRPPHPSLVTLDPGVAGAIDRLQPRLEFLVDDLTRCTEAELRRPGLTALAQLTHLCLVFLPQLDPIEALAALERWADLLRAVDRDEGPPPGPDAVAGIAGYALKVTEIPAITLHETFERILQRPEETIMSTAEKLLRQGRAETILRQMEKRFGPLPTETVQRVRSATPAELDRLTDCVLDARTLAELFAD